MFSWEQGRLNTGYYKLKLFSSKSLRCDLYLLWMGQGTHIPVHRDVVVGYRHYRFNWILWDAHVGGDFIANKSILNLNRFKLFRSDSPHSVTKIYHGNRWVLSFGLCLKEKISHV